jgi:predicted enzyme related to lactoylglutathione lyase
MAVATSTLLGRPVWYELMTTDMKAAESFYKTVVGWTTEPFPGAGQPYTALNRSGGVSIGGIMNRPPGMQAPPFWAMYVAVPKLEDAVAQITRRGGKTHTEVISIKDVGRMQLMMDPQGAAFYIIEPASSEQRPEAPPEVGDASWHELMTTDADAALKFYQEVFHWQLDQTMDMGEMGKYLIFKRPTGHGMIGGIMNKTPQMANVPPNWQIYFRVPDVDAAAERIKAAGGKILNGPMDVPDGDRIVNAMDPQGAAFGLHTKKKA